MSGNAVVPKRETSGIWMRSFSKSTERPTICGEPLIRIAMCLISWSKTDATNKQPRNFFRKLPKGLQYVPRVVITDNLARHPLSIWADPGSLSAQTASPYRSGLPCSSAGSFSGMERGDQKENCRLTPHSSSPIFRFFSLFLPFPQKALPFLCQADNTH
jgi:hypothetical protein